MARAAHPTDSHANEVELAYSLYDPEQRFHDCNLRALSGRPQRRPIRPQLPRTNGLVPLLRGRMGTHARRSRVDQERLDIDPPVFESGHNEVARTNRRYR